MDRGPDGSDETLPGFRHRSPWCRRRDKFLALSRWPIGRDCGPPTTAASARRIPSRLRRCG